MALRSRVRNRVAAALMLAMVFGVSAAVAPPANAEGYTQTLVTVAMRVGPSQQHQLIVWVPGGRSVLVHCFYDGPGAQSINGDNVWYWSTYGGHTGYIAGYYLNTGHDPNRGLAGNCSV